MLVIWVTGEGLEWEGHNRGFLWDVISKPRPTLKLMVKSPNYWSLGMDYYLHTIVLRGHNYVSKSIRA